MMEHDQEVQESHQMSHQNQQNWHHYDQEGHCMNNVVQIIVPPEIPCIGQGNKSNFSISIPIIIFKFLFLRTTKQCNSIATKCGHGWPC